MARLIMVLGALPRPVGKTGFVLALLWGLREIGVRALPVKPVSLVDWYADYDLYLRWREEGMPFPREALVFQEAEPRLGVEEASPVCIVRTPLNPGYFLEAGSPGQLYVYEADASRSSVVTRITLLGEERVGYALVNGKLLARRAARISREEIERITRRLDRVESVWGYGEYADAVAANSAIAVARGVEWLSEKSLAVVAEGLGDAAFIPGVTSDVHLVVAIYPGSALVYDPLRYLSAVAVRGRSARALRFRDIFEFLRPRGVYPLEPVSSGMLPEDIYRRNRASVEKILGFLE